jgi:pimeloyl-ACP methyl ester carboxylesterase
LQTVLLPAEIKLRLTRRPSATAPASRLEQTVAYLNGPDFIPAASQPALLQFDGPVHFHFPTPRPGDIAKNNTVYGRLYRCGQHWRERPVVILLHGAGDFPDHLVRFSLMARYCNRIGFNAATLMLPNHFRRFHPQVYQFLAPAQDYRRFADTFFAQAVAEIRALTGWLLAEGCPAVALAGASYGGWLAGMTACHDARLAAAILVVPAVGMHHFILQTEQIFWRRVRELSRGRRTAYEALDRTPINLIASQPVIPRENILVIKGEYDLLVAGGPVEDLWQAWAQPEIWRLPQGHISMFAAPGLTARMVDWLTPRWKNGPTRPAAP